MATHHLSRKQSGKNCLIVWLSPNAIVRWDCHPNLGFISMYCNHDITFTGRLFVLTAKWSVILTLSPVQVIKRLFTYCLQSSNAPWFMCLFRRNINCLFDCLLNFLPHFFPSFFPYAFFLVYFFTHLLPDLSIYCCYQNRPIPFPGWRCRMRPKWLLVVLVHFML